MTYECQSAFSIMAMTYKLADIEKEIKDKSCVDK